jgi:hypothetical protein
MLASEEHLEPFVLLLLYGQQLLMLFLVKTGERLNQVRKWRHRCRLHGGGDLPPSRVSAPV